MEHKPLTSLTDDDLDEDPLLFLAYGHILPMSSVDGVTALHDAYERGATGWLAPLPLQVGLSETFSKRWLH